MNIPKIGNMNRRVDVYKKTRTTNEIGQVAYADTLVKTVWAQISPQSGSMQYQQTETVLSNLTHVITTRYESGVDIAVGDHFAYKGRRFEIEYIIDPDTEHRVLQFQCQEVEDV
ncbi:hypothetical protein AAC03nite_28140 [Alicyclobacillus acidoterrestris]|nr:hypothetical protein AAC03nite_28140 [Alicyclobacillus acidoterrestris]